MSTSYGYGHRQDRARWQQVIDTRAGTPDPVRCWRCHAEIPPRSPAAWQLGHPTALAIGGPVTHRLPECTRCNASDGGRLRHTLTDPEPSRKW